MWAKPEQQIVSATARPVRVAYLVDLSDCPDALLDAIFAESYSRWGGRRTIIVPTTADGIDERYSEWLFYIDPDVIYSFVALSDTAVESLHERYAPAHLIRHKDWHRGPSEERTFKIELPLTGLSSLSVLPAFLSRPWGFHEPRRDLKLLTKYWDRSESPFLRENFGFLSSSFANGMIGSAHLDLYSAFTLLTAEALADRRLGKDAGATHVTSEDQVLEALASPDGPMTLAQLSDFFAPFLYLGQNAHLDGTCIIVGDTPSDRLLFWNIPHLFERHFFSEIVTLRIPTASAKDDAFLARIKRIIHRRGLRGYSGQNDHVILCSSSLEREALEEIAVRLRQGEWLSVTISQHADHAAIVPPIRDRMIARHRFGGAMFDPEGRGSAEFHGKRAPVPLVYPWHMKESPLPAGLREGCWMLDLSIDREVDHCRFVNERHAWRLPRRLRLERAFQYERDGARFSWVKANQIRIVRSGLIGIALDIDVTRASITTPDDFDAFQVGICNDREWMPFDRDREHTPHGRLRFAAAEYSDKGRYLRGVLQLFESVPDAFSVLMNAYWRDVFHYLGAVASNTDEEKENQFIEVLRRRMRQGDGALRFENDDQLGRLAQEALRAGRMVARETRYVWYGQLVKRWLRLAKYYLTAHPSTGRTDTDARVRDVRYLNRSVQYVCKREVFFQGREWRCRSCYNRNWVGIDDLSRTLVCSICGRDEPAPVSGSWQFRINPFVLEAYRDHGSEAVIWALWQLLEQSRASFYFVPSLKLWHSYPRSVADPCDAEVDDVAVVDGLVYLVEAKSSKGLGEGEIKQLLIAAERIRPDVLLVACMSPERAALDRSANELREALSPDIKVELLTFDPAALDRSPFLPG
jgi:hypothetical protein